MVVPAGDAAAELRAGERLAREQQVALRLVVARGHHVHPADRRETPVGHRVHERLDPVRVEDDGVALTAPARHRRRARRVVDVALGEHVQEAVGRAAAAPGEVVAVGQRERGVVVVLAQRRLGHAIEPVGGRALLRRRVARTLGAMDVRGPLRVLPAAGEVDLAAPGPPALAARIRRVVAHPDLPGLPAAALLAAAAVAARGVRGVATAVVGVPAGARGARTVVAAVTVAAAVAVGLALAAGGVVVPARRVPLVRRHPAAVGMPAAAHVVRHLVCAGRAAVRVAGHGVRHLVGDLVRVRVRCTRVSRAARVRVAAARHLGLLAMPVPGHLARRVVRAAVEHEGGDHERERRGAREPDDLVAEHRRRQPDAADLAAQEQQEPGDHGELEQHGDAVLEADRLHVAARQEREPGGPRDEPDPERPHRQGEGGEALRTRRPGRQQQRTEPRLKRRHDDEPGHHHGQVLVIRGRGEMDDRRAQREDGRRRGDDAAGVAEIATMRLHSELQPLPPPQVIPDERTVF